MKIRWQQQQLGDGQWRYRLVDSQQREIGWLGRFLDQLQARGRSPATIRSYAMSLANFLSWWGEQSTMAVDVAPQECWTEQTLLEYTLWQGRQQKPPSPSTINARLAAVRQLMEFHFGVPAPAPLRRNGRFSHGGRRAWPARLARVAVKVPRRQTAPLSREEVSRFWGSFRTLRDLAIVGLMLLNGLRAGEVLSLEQEDVLLSEGELRVRGKGRRLRLLPLAPETTQLLDHYLRVERPANSGRRFFVSLKGRARGKPMTAAGLRSLFRHHRQTSGIEKAHPHRFRHTFASDMIRAGVSPPALMRLMGHAQIETTMVYLSLTPEDVYREYARAVAQRVKMLEQR